MKEIIAISKREINGTEVNSVNARELHEALEVKKPFTQWIEPKLKDGMLVEGRDYISFNQVVKREIGATTRQEYTLTLDTAKHIAMMSKTAKAYEVREYFIQVEKEYINSLSKPDDTNTQVVLALNMMTKALETIVTQNQTILTMLQTQQEQIKVDTKLEVKFADKPNTRMMKRRLSNEDKFIAKVIDVLKKEEGLTKLQILERAGYYKSHKTARAWLDSYDGIYWRANVGTDCKYSFSLIEGEIVA